MNDASGSSVKLRAKISIRNLRPTLRCAFTAINRISAPKTVYMNRTDTRRRR
jgi:hypothetical protein